MTAVEMREAAPLATRNGSRKGNNDLTSIIPAELALEWATAGADVLPCKLDKSPYLDDGYHGASNDPERIAAWWDRWPDALVGVVPWSLGAVVADVDDKSGKTGTANLAAAGVDLSTGWDCPSLSGTGRHVWFSTSEPVGNASVIGADGLRVNDVDVRGASGYVVAPYLPPVGVDLVSLPASVRLAGASVTGTEATARELSEWLSAHGGAESAGMAETRDLWERRFEKLRTAGKLDHTHAVWAIWAVVQDARKGETGAALALDLLESAFVVDPATGEVRDDWSADWARALAGAVGKTAAPVEAEEVAPFRIISRSELRSRPKPEWIVEGLIQGSGVGVLGADGGLGKSFLMVGVGASVATGTDWFGRKVKRGKVLYVAAEGIEYFDDRLTAWETAHGVTVPDDSFLFVEEGFKLTKENTVEHMIGLVREHGFDLVVLDTLSQLSSGITSENAAAELSTVMDAARRIRQARPGSTVMIVHHTGMNGTLRGSTAIRDNADFVIIGKKSGDMFSLSTKIEHDGKNKNAPSELLDGFMLTDCGPSAVVTRVELDVLGVELWKIMRAMPDDGITRSEIEKALDDAEVKWSRHQLDDRLGKLLTGEKIRHNGKSGRGSRYLPA